jgi:hypothetical protein
VPTAGVTYAGPSCPHCRQPLELDRLLSGPQVCERCGRAFEAVRFDPPPRAPAAPTPAADGDAASACPAHKGNAAVTSCERCGVFLCALCRIDVEGQVLCPACFSRLAADGELLLARSRFRDYDAVAWLALAVGVITWLPGVVTGPAAVYFSVQGRRQRLSWGDAPQSGRVALAVALGLVNVALSVGLVAVLVST